MTRRLFLTFVTVLVVGLPQALGQELVYDVRNGDQQGKLLIKDSELAFESLSDAKQSRSWKYSEIRELSRRGKDLRVRPFKGSRYDFQFKDRKLRDQIYDQISQRILAARHGNR
jgi:hypothetical protein